MYTNKIVKNAAWIIVCRVMQSVLSLIVSMLTARYLGPSNYGVINYAAAVVSFVVPLMQLGFRNTLVREFVNDPEKEGEILGTALVLNLLSAFLCIVGVISFVSIANRGETETIVVCVLYSLNLIFQALEMSQYWFQVKLLSKYTAVVSLIAYAVVTIYRIFLLITQKNIFWFAVSQTLDFMLISVILLIIYKKIASQRLQFSWQTGRRMLASSRHYIVSSVMVTVFGHVGSIFLKFLADDAAVGYYTAAVSCAGMTNFIFAAIVDSFRPAILGNKQTGNVEIFRRNNIHLYSIIIYMSLIQGITMCVFSPLIVKILYGIEYVATVAPLRIMAFYALFSNIGMVRNVWILAHEKQKYLWIINLTGAITNVLLNFVLIPTWGISGAAIASVLTQFVTNVVTSFILQPMKENGSLMIASLNPKNLLQIFRYIIRKRDLG